MTTSDVAALVSAIAAVIASVAAWRTYALSRSVAGRTSEAERAALARELIETARMIQSEAHRGLGLCLRHRALFDSLLALTGNFGGSVHTGKQAEADSYAQRIKEIRQEADKVIGIACSRLTTEDLSDRLPRLRANLTVLRTMVDDLIASCESTAANIDSTKERQRRDLDRILGRP